MGFHDRLLAFCDDCEATFSVMIDQHGQVVIACACAADRGVKELAEGTQEWVHERGHRMGTDKLAESNNE